MDEPKVIVAHLGARLHYAVATLLQQSGLLSHFYTDLFLSDPSMPYKLTRSLQKLTNFNPLKKLQTRSATIPSHKVTTFSRLGLSYYKALQKGDSTDVFYRYSSRFAKKVADHPALKEGDIIYGFTGSALEIFDRAKASGKTCVLEQMSAPVATSNRVISGEMKSWPDWQTEHFTLWELDKWQPRERKEWELANIIIAPSLYVKNELENHGVSPDKIKLIPFAVSEEKFPKYLHTYDGKRKLRILYVGAMRLLKGVPYLIKALELLPANSFKAVLVGQNHFNTDVLSSFPPEVTVKNQVPRNELSELYKWADVFVMPSLCEGSATVNYEARASGLPAVATFTSGTWIEDEQEGYIVEPGNPEQIASAIQAFLDSPAKVQEMSNNNLRNLSEYTWEAYQNRLINLIHSL